MIFAAVEIRVVSSGQVSVVIWMVGIVVLGFFFPFFFLPKKGSADCKRTVACFSLPACLDARSYLR